MNWTAIICILISYLPCHTFSLEHDGSAIIHLQHALTGGPDPQFKDRGKITVNSLRIGQAIVDQKPLAEADRKLIQKLARENDLYRIQATVIANDGSKKTFLSSVKACMLAEAELDDRLSLSFDYLGHIIGVSLVIASKSSCEGSDVPLEKLKEFTTNVYVRHTDTATIPDTASYIEKIERERDAKEKGDVKDNKSFLAKYWMYILPVVILMVISSATNPEAQGGGQ
ncbi:ER membrane protein complex subunit 10 [Sitophilus oryzae]|uniref:ER membrane protein complex subunit 10 n=1 Tax=Sitophilus oryzae TaxID=7048 RepID=A0A6J2Y356_SITOR|nr:ER membrane protein complex subunit 10 [Sitophilus oryzae]